MSKIKDFLIKLSFIRFVRSFFHNQLLFYIKYSFYLLLALFTLGFLYLFFFDKQLIKSLQNYVRQFSLDIAGLDQKNYSRINISGNNYTDYEEIAAIVRSEMRDIELSDDLDYVPIINILQKKIEQLPWIEEVIVSRSLPNELNISVKEKQPFAIWQNDNKKYIINKNGVVINVNYITPFYDLLILTGDKANLNVASLANILVLDKKISSDVYYATWIGDRRWDIKFANGLLVKLPKNMTKEAWLQLIKIYNQPGALADLKIIDLRINGKIYLEYGDKSIAELKSL